MLEMGIVVLVFMAVSLIFQERFSVPMPVSIMTITLILVFIGVDHFSVKGHVFDELILLLLPLLITADILNLKTEDLVKHWKTVFLTAGVAVVMSVIVGVALHQLILPGYDIPIAAMVALMAMIAATDPVSVTAVFSNFKVPHKLKFIAESESLFNDATAFVIFSLAVLSMTHQMTSVDLVVISMTTVITSVLTGVIFGFIGVFLMRFASEALTQTSVALLIGYVAFFVADEMGKASIFALVTSLVVIKAVVTFAHNTEQSASFWFRFKYLETAHENRNEIVQFLTFVALIANVILFISMAHLFNLQSILGYWKEILAVFVASTFIRAVMMWQFMRTSNRYESLQSVSWDWWAILVFAGIKGGLSILMVHMLPGNFEYKDLFTAIIIGNILLTTFIYSFALSFFIRWRKKQILSSDL